MHLQFYNMKEKTAEDFRQAVKDKGIQTWKLRECSICGSDLNYVFSKDQVYYDSNCGCTKYYTEIQLRSYEELARRYNTNLTFPEYIKEIDEFFGFKE
jgi:hypothetical protein